MKIDRRVLGQNGNGQNGTDKMVYGQNGIIGQNGSGQNGADKMARIKSSIYQSIPKTLTIRFFHQSRFHLTILGFLCIYHLFWTSGYEYKLFNWIKIYKKIATILSIPFCPYHIVQYHFVRCCIWGTIDVEGSRKEDAFCLDCYCLIVIYLVVSVESPGRVDFHSPKAVTSRLPPDGCEKVEGKFQEIE